MDRNADRPPTPVAMVTAYPREVVDAVDKHTGLDSVEILRQRKRELEEQIHQHTEHLRMPIKNNNKNNNNNFNYNNSKAAWSSRPAGTTHSNTKPLQHSSQIRVIQQHQQPHGQHRHHRGCDNDDDSLASSSSSSSSSSWGDTNAEPDTTVGPSTCAQDTAIQVAQLLHEQQQQQQQQQPKLATFLRHAEHRVQISNEVSSVSCSEFGDSYCGDGDSLHDSISTYHMPSRAVMNYLLQHHSEDDDDEYDEEEGKDEESDWNPNNEDHLRKQQQRRRHSPTAAPAGSGAATNGKKRLVDTSTLGVFVPSSIQSEVVNVGSSDSNAPHSVTNVSAATNTTENSCSTEDDIEMAIKKKTTASPNGVAASKTKPTTMVPSSSAGGNKKVGFVKNYPEYNSDPTTMEDDITTLTGKFPGRRNTKCIIVTAVIVLLALIVIALMALIGVMLRNSLRHS